MSNHQDPEKFAEILEAAARLFAEQGYHATSMRAVAAAVGLNPSSLYHHFAGKEEILYTLLDRAMDDALEVLEGLAEQPMPPKDKARRLLSFYARYFAGDRYRLELLVNEVRSLSEPMRHQLETKERGYVGLFRSLMDELAGAGLLRQVDRSVAVFSFFGMVHYTLRWYRPEGPIGLDDLADQLIDIFLGGVLQP